MTDFFLQPVHQHDGQQESLFTLTNEKAMMLLSQTQ